MTKRRKDPQLFITRELSWLDFNGRVLDEALDARTPLLERAKFASITASNLDEFFMVRVARLAHAIAENDVDPDVAGLTPAQQLLAVSERAHALVAQLYALVQNELTPALASQSVRLLTVDALTDAERDAVASYFRDQVLPALTPLAIDFSRPFPMLSSLSLNLAVRLPPVNEGEAYRVAVVQVPAMLPRLVRVAGADGTTFVWLEDIVRAHLASLFVGQKVLEANAFRLSRDSEMELDDEGGRSFLEVVEQELRRRRQSDVVRLEVEAGMSPELLGVLASELNVAEVDIYRCPGPLDLRALMSLVDLPDLEELRDPPLKPADPLDEDELADLFSVLDERDVLLHHPYDSFDPVVALVEQAANDPDVLAIKQTLYRTSGDSPVIGALRRAADTGKQVAVLVELTARFDEQRNILWARTLEEAGAHVIYGIQGYKTHAKICLVVRRTKQGIRRYVHLGTGNYNDRTARLYTDFGLMTSSPAIAEDASAFFSSLTGYSDPPRMKKLVMAPTQMRERFLKLIDRERRRAESGQPSEIRAKVNSLIDEDIIRALYKASQAGVRIMLNVRGSCALRPGVKGVSETIDVVSIVDRFLEHSRVYYFKNGGTDEVYLSSADWMSRNLDKRIELLFPVDAPECRAKVLYALDAMFRDNVKARKLGADATYRRLKPGRGEEPFRVQIHLHQEARRGAKRDRSKAVTFTPRTAPE